MGEIDYPFHGQWKFAGNYTVSDSDENSFILSVPTSGKNNIYYPTVNNYQSIEKQTQDWVDNTEAAPADDGVAVDENAIIGAVADGKVISPYSNGTFRFAYDITHPSEKAKNAQRVSIFHERPSICAKISESQSYSVEVGAWL